MGGKQIGFFMIFFCQLLQALAASSPLPDKVSISEIVSLQEHKLGLRGKHAYSINNVNGDGKVRGGSKYAHGGGGSGGINGGGNGGGSAENSHGNGQGGAAVIPVIVAGAASNRHPTHRGATSSIRNAIGLPTMIMINLATLTLHLSVELGCLIN